jgi:hypothetical protein
MTRDFKKIGALDPLLVVFAITLSCLPFLERAIWWHDAKSCEAKGVVERRDTGVEAGDDGLVGFKYKDGVFHFRWSTLGNPWEEGLWPFIKTVEINPMKSRRLTAKQLRMLLDKEYASKNLKYWRTTLLEMVGALSNSGPRFSKGAD